MIGEGGEMIDNRDPVILAQVSQKTIDAAGLTEDEIQNSSTGLNKLSIPDSEEITESELAETEDRLDELDPETRFIPGIGELEKAGQTGAFSAEWVEWRKSVIRGEFEAQQQIKEQGPNSIALTYGQPNVSVSTQNRFAEFETIGGPIIRQKLGEGRTEINIDGVCTTLEASLIDALKVERTVRIISNRFEGNVDVASASTDPLEDGGAMNLDGNFTHSFGLSLVEVEQ